MMFQKPISDKTNDLDRLRSEYERRDHHLAGSDVYSYFNSGNLFAVQGRQRIILNVLKSAGIVSLRDKRVLEVGCGEGGMLLEFLSYGAKSRDLYGMDLLARRLTKARERLSQLSLICADGQYLPYQNDSFDIVMQFTVFSSILDDEIKANIAREMLRVLKSDGIILWYDFWLNPINAQTRGIRPMEIRRLFAGCQCQFWRATLAPPLARKLVPCSWVMSLLLEKCALLNSHYVALIKPAERYYA